MLGTRYCRSCGGEMAVAGSQGHLRCPHCRCWLPTGESWTMPLVVIAVLGLIAYIWYRLF